jgi:hypothetical protein
MSLGVYKINDLGAYEQHSEDGAMTNPITTVHHGRDGDVFEKQLYIIASDEHAYTNIQVKAVSTTSDDDIGLGSNEGTSGWGVKLTTQDYNPTETDWDAIEYGVAVDISSIAASTTIRSFWVRIESPRGISVGNKENIKLLLFYTDTP